MESKPKNKILLTGGGTLGSVIPLLAIHDYLKDEAKFFWVGSKNGIEKNVVIEAGLPIYEISSGKLKRYWSWDNVLSPWLILLGIWQSFKIIKTEQPNLLITAGSFVSVPVAIACWLKRVPILVHQLDYQAGLANKIMARLAKQVTVSFAKSTKDYPDKAKWVGLPVRTKLLSETSNLETIRKDFKLESDEPVILVLGGGTGAHDLNRLVTDNLYNLTQVCQIIHLTGKGKFLTVTNNSRYHQIPFLNQAQMAQVYKIADLVVSRAGMGTLAELAYLAKPAILIPMPNSHQENNARVLAETNSAIVLSQKRLSSLELYRQIKNLLADEVKMKSLGQNLAKTLKIDSQQEIVEVINKLIS
jgi:UDP-N-acetylglucosamine--N-acetylmuramyl-(pentapeptide) pyrophosphoryl-undecaprenol N-acetylglucosamine transferase